MWWYTSVVQQLRRWRQEAGESGVRGQSELYRPCLKKQNNEKEEEPFEK
jgi:hypothetical protein